MAEVDALQAVAPRPAPRRLRQPVECAVAQTCTCSSYLLDQLLYQH